MSQYLGRQVLQDGGAVDGGRGPDASMARRPVLEVPVDPSHGELQWKLRVNILLARLLPGRHVKRHFPAFPLIELITTLQIIYVRGYQLEQGDTVGKNR